MTVNSTRDFIPPEPFEGQNYKLRYARPSASLREELLSVSFLYCLPFSSYKCIMQLVFPDVTLGYSVGFISESKILNK